MRNPVTEDRVWRTQKPHTGTMAIPHRAGQFDRRPLHDPVPWLSMATRRLPPLIPLTNAAVEYSCLNLFRFHRGS